MSEKKKVGKVFINYRRDDASGFSGRIFDRLKNHFPSDNLFMDVVGIEPGKNFMEIINSQIWQCAVFLCIIGEHWLDINDKSGNRRLDSAEDYVRVELELAIRNDILIIPILVNKAVMPDPALLPQSLRPLASYNAVRITHERFDSDSSDLIRLVDYALKQTGVYPNQYTNLERFLKSGSLKSANKETKLLIQQLSSGNLITIGSAELQMIDRLWVKYSNGLFGFSVQKQILREAQGDLREFWRRVVWLNRFSIWSDKDLESGLIFSVNAPKGHLPFILDLFRYPILKAVITIPVWWLAASTWWPLLDDTNEKAQQFKTFLLRQDL
jgi:hypothetical protein